MNDPIHACNARLDIMCSQSDDMPLEILDKLKGNYVNC